ncbi:MAG: PLP-dependent aminotransferase family protein [Clostridium sp.]|nr:PLP-dependent aminotransferase family protein [Clostridium sp.]
MLTYNFVNIGSDSLYMYLYKCIKNDIKEGKLKVGEKLPSKRAFAKNLGISVITVENAYSQLIAEGFINSLPKKGFYVSDLKDTGIQNIGIDKEKVILSGEENSYIADFTSNQTDRDVFPFSIWTKTMREVMNENQTQLMINPPCGGIMELRRGISKYLSEFRGMKVNPEQIIIGAGTEYLYGLIIQLLGSGVVYGVENPGYPKIAQIYRSMNVPCKYIDIDKYGVPTDSLEEKKIDVMHISPSHHFPTGIVMPISRRYELLGWASKKDGRYIIEDDYDSELRLTGKPIPTLQSIDVSDKVIYMNTFTKTLCSTVRISYMVLPEELANKFYKKLSFYSCTVSNFEQYTLAKFLENGNFEKHINRLRKYYQNKRDAILKCFKKDPIEKYISIMEEEAGVHFLMHIKTKKEEKEFVCAAKGKGIKLMPLSRYYYGSENKYSNIYVINYTSIDVENLNEIVEALYNVVSK